MGLDLTLYCKPKSISYNDYDHHIELAYGRKTWAISDFFTEDCGCEVIQDDYLYRVTKGDWEYFMAVVRPVFTNRFVVNMLESYNEFEDEDEYGITEELIKYCLNTIFNSSYCLGPMWEARAAYRWFQADKKVRIAFEAGADVFIERSYQKGEVNGQNCQN